MGDAIQSRLRVVYKIDHAKPCVMTIPDDDEDAMSSGDRRGQGLAGSSHEGEGTAGSSHEGEGTAGSSHEREGTAA